MKGAIFIKTSIVVVRFFAVGLICATMANCTSNKVPTPSAVYNPLDTPPHNMTKSQYPFDNDGQYRRDWVKSGSNDRISSTSKPPAPVPNQYGARPSVSVPMNTVSSAPPPPPQINIPPQRAPVAPAPAPAPAPATYHTVQKGDTLYAISRRHGLSVAALKSKNGLSSDMIRIGQRLRVR